MKFWKIFLLVSVPYAFLMCVFKIVTGDFAAGSMIGGAHCLLWSSLVSSSRSHVVHWFTKYQMKRIVVELEADEKVIKEGGANRILNLEGVGGNSFLLTSG